VRLSANFELSEFACKCCGAVIVSSDLYDLVGRLQAVRNWIGRPVRVTSGYRCREHDARVGTSSNPGAGPHTQGIAADIVVDGMSADDLAEVCMTAGLSGVGVYRKKGFVHVDVRSVPAVWYEE
jgi:uncharacterized protein YcbK (DUF882 family)